MIASCVCASTARPLGQQTAGRRPRGGKLQQLATRQTFDIWSFASGRIVRHRDLHHTQTSAHILVDRRVPGRAASVGQRARRRDPGGPRRGDAIRARRRPGRGRPAARRRRPSPRRSRRAPRAAPDSSGGRRRGSRDRGRARRRPRRAQGGAAARVRRARPVCRRRDRSGPASYAERRRRVRSSTRTGCVAPTTARACGSAPRWWRRETAGRDRHRDARRAPRLRAVR